MKGRCNNKALRSLKTPIDVYNVNGMTPHGYNWRIPQIQPQQPFGGESLAAVCNPFLESTTADKNEESAVMQQSSRRCVHNNNLQASINDTEEKKSEDKKPKIDLSEQVINLPAHLSFVEKAALLETLCVDFSIITKDQVFETLKHVINEELGEKEETSND